MMETKSEIRKRMLIRRSAMNPEEVRLKSDAIFSRLCALAEYNQAKTILAYMDIRNEVRTDGFIRRCLNDGKRVALPKVVSVADPLEVSGTAPAENVPALAVYEILRPERDVAPGFKGIPEPDASVLKRLDPAEIDLAVIPGVAFDPGRNRVGYGAGYYDRFIGRLRPDCLRIAVAYGFQLVDSIPADRYDMQMDMVITEDMLME